MRNIVYYKIPRTASSSIRDFCVFNEFSYFQMDLKIPPHYRGGTPIRDWIKRYGHSEQTEGQPLDNRVLPRYESLEQRKNIFQDEVEHYLGKDTFIFSSIRNPYDRAVSTWKHKSFLESFGKDPSGYTAESAAFLETTFPLFCKCLLDKNFESEEQLWHSQPYYDSLFDAEGNELFNFIIKTESIQDDMNLLCDKIGVPHYKMAQTNKSVHKHYTEYYNDETKEIIDEVYKKDIEAFGYEFKP